MNSILFIISITIPLLIGFLAIRVAEGKKQIFCLSEKLVLSFPFGAGITAFYLFYISILGFNITIISTIPLFILSVLGILKFRQLKSKSSIYAVFKEKGCADKNSWKKTALLGFFGIVIAWKLFFMFFNATVIPPFFDDAITCWSYKAKVIYFNKSIELDPNNPLFLGGAYSHYPLGPSLFRVWISLIMGGWHESYIQLHSFIMLLCLVLFIFISLREYVSFFTRLISCYLIVSIPLLSIHAHAGYADIILSYYITVGFILFIKWFFAKENNILIIAAASMAAAIFTKNEGLVLYLPAALITLSYYCYKIAMKLDEKIKAVSIYMLTLCIVGGPWIVFKIVYSIPLW